MKKPKNRSKVRLLAGRFFYFGKKYVDWMLPWKRFAKEKSAVFLPYSIFTHQSLLLRPLKDVDIRLQYNKITNLKIAIKNIDGVVLRPGEVFSYWKLIGKPTARKGYLSGMVLFNGTVDEGIGGGLCQLSNLVYWLTLHSPLTVTERWRHSYDVFPDANRTQPFGSGATCSYPNVDLQIKNTTDQIFQLKLEVTETHLVGEWLSDKSIEVEFKIEERDAHIKQEWWGGYTRNNKIFQIVFDKQTGAKIDEKLVAENHAIMMYEPLIENHQAR